MFDKNDHSYKPKQNGERSEEDRQKQQSKKIHTKSPAYISISSKTAIHKKTRFVLTHLLSLNTKHVKVHLVMVPRHAHDSGPSSLARWPRMRKHGVTENKSKCVLQYICLNFFILLRCLIDSYINRKKRKLSHYVLFFIGHRFFFWVFIDRSRTLKKQKHFFSIQVSRLTETHFSKTTTLRTKIVRLTILKENIL